MFSIRRDRKVTTRFLAQRVTLFFLAAGIWLIGVVLHDDRITAAGLVVAVLAFIFEMFLRRQSDGEAE